MPYLYPPELALSDCLRSRQEGEQAEKPGDMKSDINHWLPEIGSWVQTSEISSARRASIDLDDNDVKPPQTTDLPPAHPSGSFDGSFESGEPYRWSGDWSVDEAERRTGSDADTRRSAEAEIDRVRQDSKMEDTDSLGAIKSGTYRQLGAMQRLAMVQFPEDGGLVSSGKEKNGEMLLRWSKVSSEDPWHMERDEGTVQ